MSLFIIVHNEYMEHPVIVRIDRLPRRDDHLADLTVTTYYLSTLLEA